jgi:hypothetical protein
LAIWEKELVNDPDRDFILDGIKQGFRITDKGSQVTNVETKNHKSAVQCHELVEKELLSQIKEGNYCVASSKPAIVSPLAAIEKEGGGIRLIHDGSRPVGQALNDYATLHSVRFQTIEAACKLAQPNYWCAKLDLKAAYRSVPIHKDDYKATGLKWQFRGQEQATYLFDTRLPFGATLAPGTFHRLSQAVSRCLRRRGLCATVTYIDDFLIIAKTFEECREALNQLIRLVRSLGFYISWQKVVGPTQKITFLGVDIDTSTSTLSLGKDKLEKVKNELNKFVSKKRASKRQLQRLAGLLNWACQVVRGGSFFMRRILDTIKPLQQQHHKAQLGKEFKRDLGWWLTFLDMFNGVVFYNKCVVHHVHVDACQKAYGAFFMGDWVYSMFACDAQAFSEAHINCKEIVAAVAGIERWAHLFRDSEVIIHTDNSVAKAAVNKGRCRNALINCLLRRLFWLSVRYNFVVRAIHVPGKINIFPDTISRLHEPGKLELMQTLLARWSHCVGAENADLACHMSDASYCGLTQVRQRRLKPR